MNRRPWLWAGLALSLLLHASALFVAAPFQTKRQSMKTSYRQKVVVRMVTHPAKAVVAPTVMARHAQRAVGHPAPVMARRDDSRAAGHLESEKYGTLLPGLNNLPTEAAGSGTDQPFAPPSQAASTVADELSGKLDIPLFFRQQGDNARASAKLELKEGGTAGWWFAYVAGDPLLRAVLFEALRDPANAAAVLDLFRELRTSELILSLRQKTVRQPDPHEHYGETVRVEGNKLIIERTLYLAPPLEGGGGGILLPDREAERAVERDKMRLERLTLSPAYVSPLRERYP